MADYNRYHNNIWQLVAQHDSHMREGLFEVKIRF